MNELKQPKHRSFLTRCFVSILLFALMMVSISCGEAKKANNKTEVSKLEVNQPEVDQPTTDFTPNYNISSRTKSFLAAFENEISGQGNDLENVKLSEEFIESYNVRTQNDVYSISGFIQGNENFDSSLLDRIDVAHRPPSGAITTVHVPLKSLSQFLKTPGIEYFEISEKVTIK